MTSSYVVAVECEGFQPLDPRDPENLDRKHDDRDPKVVERRRKDHRRDAEKQRSGIFDLLDNVTAGSDVKLVDKFIRDDGTAILYFSFDPSPEGDHFVEHEERRLDENTDAEKGPVVTARRVMVEVPADTEGEGAKTWDSALRNEVEQARSSCVGAGLQVVECRIEVRETGKKADTTKRQRSRAVSDKSTHQETKGSDEPNLSDPEVQDQRAEELREQEQDREATAEAVADDADQSKGNRSKS